MISYFIFSLPYFLIFLLCCVYSSFQVVLKYFRYFLTSSNGRGHGVHSPFVYEFVKQVLNDNRQFHCFNSIERLRNELKSDKTEIEVPDFGAGSRLSAGRRRKVSSVAFSSLKPEKYAQLLFRLVHFYKPQTIVELGTSLGVSTAYLSCANPDAQIITMEGAPEIATIAKANFERLQLKNIEVVRGNFDETLPSVISQLSIINFAFIDGNHRKEPTLHYFDLLIAKANSSSILVFDDIHWSRDMEAAWEAIKCHPSITLTIDLFFIGIVFLRTEQIVAEHFTIRF